MVWFEQAFGWVTPRLMSGGPASPEHISSSYDQLEQKVCSFIIQDCDFNGYEIYTLRNIFLYVVSLTRLKTLNPNMLLQPIDFITQDTTMETYLDRIDNLSRSTLVHLIKVYCDEDKLIKLLALGVGIVDYDTIGLLSYSEVLKLYYAWILDYTNETRGQVENNILWAQTYLMMSKVFDYDEDNTLFELLQRLNFGDIPDRIQITTRRQLVSTIVNIMSQGVEEIEAPTEPYNHNQMVSMILSFLGSGSLPNELPPDELRVIREISSPQTLTQVAVSPDEEDRISFEAISGQYVKCSNATAHYYNLDSYKEYMRLTEQSKIAHCPTCKSIMLGQVFTT